MDKWIRYIFIHLSNKIFIKKRKDKSFMITPRLECILNHVKGEYIADIGTDHAYIPIKLIMDNRCKRAIATDIKKGPVEIAKNNVKKYKLEDKIEVRQGCGLNPLKKGEQDTILICGMGGQLIINILSENEDLARSSKLILQPMNCQYELRKYLIDNDYKITCEDIATEGFKVYNILEVEDGKSDKFEREIYYHIPKYLINHKYFKDLYEKKYREFSKILDGLNKSKTKDIESIEKYTFLINELKKLQEIN